VRVVLLALSVGNAMGQYLNLLEKSLAQEIELHLVVPSHYEGQSSASIIHKFQTSKEKGKALRRLLNPFAAYTVWKQIKNIKPDVIHLFNGEGYPWAPLLVSWIRAAGIPLVVTVHDPEPHPRGWVDAVNSILRRFVYKKAKFIHIHSEIFIPSIVNKGVSEEAIRIIPIGSFAELFTIYTEPQVIREKAVLFFGRLEYYKGIDILVESAKLLPNGFRVIIAGPGKLKKTTIDQINCNDIFELHNRFISNSEVSLLFRRSSVCVLPYRQVTQSAVPLISAAFSVPVVASNLGGFKEDVIRVNGLLITPESPNELAKAIVKAVNIVPLYPKELEFGVLALEFVKLYRDSLKSNI